MDIEDTMMFRKRKKRIRTAWLILAIYILFGAVCAENIVLCVGIDGGVSVEHSVEGLCLDDIKAKQESTGSTHTYSRHGHPSSHGEECGPCRDIALSSDKTNNNIFVRKSVLPTLQFSQPVSFVDYMGDRPVFYGKGFFEDNTNTYDQLLLIRTVVLLS